MYDRCFICGNPIPQYQWLPRNTKPIECKICGPYLISERAAQAAFPHGLPESHIYSGAVRELNEKGRQVVIESFEQLRDSVVVPEGPLERIDRILLYVLRKMDTYDEGVPISQQYDYSVAYARNPAEFRFLLNRAIGIGYLEFDDEAAYRLTLKGWEHAAQLSQSRVRPNLAFVAMSFDADLRPVYLEAIRPALEQTGYVPFRVDDAQYNEKIDDRIIADIRKSGLLIADFTQHKGGVYFEAGFALGLGVPVIWTCRETDVSGAHFDTRQYNYIVWKDASDLREKLVARIEATVPLKKSYSLLE
jgi:hypothetical protein